MRNGSVWGVSRLFVVCLMSSHGPDSAICFSDAVAEGLLRLEQTSGRRWRQGGWKKLSASAGPSRLFAPALSCSNQFGGAKNSVARRAIQRNARAPTWFRREWASSQRARYDKLPAPLARCPGLLGLS